ncbi:D-Ala-D-Ala carboxypeptidase family metallohydrolase [Enterovibrio calviensis]|uniref:D-Ala-D-Ala carboxypeptidase family metallohydrolase n=1 Tax=Enterovibrio calviensis TaxID=91359 RepID=UPI0006848C61
MKILARTEHFNPKYDLKLVCSCGCGNSVSQGLLDRVELVRRLFGKPMRVTSGYRCEAYNKKVGGAKNSMHLTGNAVDIACTDSSDRARLIRLGLHAGMSIGIREDMIHFDIRPHQIVFTY